MIFVDQIKTRFVAMLVAREIVVIQKNSTRRAKSFKFIGANSAGKWDFSPMIADTSGCKTCGSSDKEDISVVGIDAADIIVKSLYQLAEEDYLVIGNKSKHEWYEWVRDKLTTFYI